MVRERLKKIFPKWQNALLALLAAGLLILAFPDFEWWWTAWFALVPLMWAVEREKASSWRAFLLGWLFGTAYLFGTCWWLTYAPIHYAAVPWPLAYLMIFVACLLSGLFAGLFAAILAPLLRRFGSWAFLAAPFVWVFTEFARYWLTGNDWNAIGYSQAFAWLREMSVLSAQVGGIYLVGFTVSVFNSLVLTSILARRRRGQAGSENQAPYLLEQAALVGYLYPLLGVLFLFQIHKDEIAPFSSRKLRTFGVLLLIGFSVFVWWVTKQPSWSFGRFSSGDVFITAVQPNVPMTGINSADLGRLRDRQMEITGSAFEDNLARYQAADLGILDTIDEARDAEFFREKFRKASKVIVLPESPMNFAYNDDRAFQQFIGDFARRNNVSVLFNSAEPDKGTTKYFNSAVMVGPDGKKAAEYDKIYLLPFGEAVPFPFEGLMPAFVGQFAYGRNYTLLPIGDAKAGVMICFESHFGQLSRQYVRDGADAIIEMTNDGYLGPTPVLRQHLANAVFRAVETNRPVLRVTNVGITAYIDERGNVHDELPPYTEGTRVWSVSKSDGSQTFYVKYGDWFAWLCTVATIFMLGLAMRRRNEEVAQSLGD